LSLSFFAHVVGRRLGACKDWFIAAIDPLSDHECNARDRKPSLENQSIGGHAVRLSVVQEEVSSDD